VLLPPRCLATLAAVVVTGLLTVPAARGDDERPAGTQTVVLKPATLINAFDVPLPARHVLDEAMAKRLFGEEGRLEVQKNGIRITDGKKRFSRTPIRSDKPKLLKLGIREAPQDVLVYLDGDTWIAAAATTWTGRIHGHTVALLDADLDGTIAPGRDCVRWG